MDNPSTHAVHVRRRTPMFRPYGDMMVMDEGALILLIFFLIIEFFVTEIPIFWSPTKATTLLDELQVASADFQPLVALEYAFLILPCIKIAGLLQLIPYYATILHFLQMIATYVVSKWRQLSADVRTWYDIWYFFHKDQLQGIKRTFWRRKVMGPLCVFIVARLIWWYIVARYHANMANIPHLDMCEATYPNSLFDREYCFSKAFWLPAPQPSAIITPDDTSKASEQVISDEWHCWPEPSPTNCAQHLKYGVPAPSSTDGGCAPASPTTVSVSATITNDPSSTEPEIPDWVTSALLTPSNGETIMSAVSPEPTVERKGIRLVDAAEAYSILSRLFPWLRRFLPTTFSSPVKQTKSSFTAPTTTTHEDLIQTWEAEEPQPVYETMRPVLTDEQKEFVLLEQCVETFRLGPKETEAIFKNCGPCGRVEKSPAFQPCKTGPEGKKFLDMVESWRKERADEFAAQQKQAFKDEFASRGGASWLAENDNPPQSRKYEWQGDDVFGGPH